MYQIEGVRPTTGADRSVRRGLDGRPASGRSVSGGRGRWRPGSWRPPAGTASPKPAAAGGIRRAGRRRRRPRSGRRSRGSSANQPASTSRAGLGVELDAPGGAAQAKDLGVAVTARDEHGLGGQAAGVLPPVEDEGAVSMPASRASSRSTANGYQPSASSARLTTPPPQAVASCCAPRQMPSVGTPLRTAAAEQLPLGQQEGIVGLFADVHLAPQDDERGVAGETRGDLVAGAEPAYVEPQAGPDQRLAEDRRRSARLVLQDDDTVRRFAH